jgi:glutamyl-tRNA synthetase
VGNARTALFNWLFARGRGGVFVLRVEDTDRERSSLESERAMLESLRWLGLDWDEGPEAGGDHGPYRQSERLQIYAAEARRLVGRDLAYPCFCSDERLASERERAQAEKRAPVYDGTCVGLDPDEAARRAASEPHTLRFRAPERDYTVDDLVRGPVTFPAGAVGDFILLRQDGMPVYNFACVVDDALMEISHVLRGEDHLPNTLRQVMLYEALEKEPPRFGHLSMILGEDRSKLSKRHGAVSVEDFRERGYLPEALFNYLALLGWNPGDEREEMSPAEITEAFGPERLNKAPAIFDRGKMDWIAGLKIRARKPDELLEIARDFLPGESDGRRIKMIAAAQDHLRCMADLPEALEALRQAPSDPDAEAAAWLEDAGELFEVLAAELGALEGELSAEAFKAAMKSAGKAAGRKGKTLFMPVRVKLTGLMHGPDLAATAEILGLGEVLDRLRA